MEKDREYYERRLSDIRHEMNERNRKLSGMSTERSHLQRKVEYAKADLDNHTKKMERISKRVQVLKNEEIQVKKELLKCR